MHRLALQLAFHDLARGHKSIQIDAGLHPLRFEHEHQILGHDVAAGPRCIGASAKTAQAGVEFAHAGIQGCEHIGEAQATGVVEVGAHRHVLADRAVKLGEQIADLFRIGVADRVGDVQAVGAAPHQSFGNLHHVLDRHGT